MAKKKSGLSVRTVTLLAMGVVAYLAWGVAAAGYAGHAEGWRAGGQAIDVLQTSRPTRSRGIVAMAAALVDFGVNSVVQIPRGFSVIGHTFRERLWLPVVAAAVIALTAFGGYRLHAFEQTLEQEKRRRRR
jgi:hypothetical protein